MTMYGAYPPPPPPPLPKRRRWPAVVGGLVALVVLVAACNSASRGAAGQQSTSAPAVETPRHLTSTPPAGPAATVADGVYEVGPDLVAGRYKTQGPDQSDIIPNCYWARTKDDSGSFKAIIANDNVRGPGSVTVKSGEFVTFTGGCTWTKQ